MSVSGCAQVVSPEYVTFVVLMFVNATGTAGVYPLAFIIGKLIVPFHGLSFIAISSFMQASSWWAKESVKSQE
jgi:hypothetical protein